VFAKDIELFESSYDGRTNDDVRVLDVRSGYPVARKLLGSGVEGRALDGELLLYFG
jgi:hypothetical protein